MTFGTLLKWQKGEDYLEKVKESNPKRRSRPFTVSTSQAYIKG